MIDGRISICHISEATAGGVFTHLKQVAQNLDTNAFEQTFILSSAKNIHLRSFDTFYGNRLHVVDMERNVNPLKDFQSMMTIKKLLRHRRYDVVHCHSSKAGVLGRIATWELGCGKTIYSPHAFAFNNFQNPLKRKLLVYAERSLARLSCNIICVSHGEYLEAIRHDISDEGKLTIIPNGLDTGVRSFVEDKRLWIKTHGLNGTEKIIGFVGRLVRQKNAEMLIRACAGLVHVDCAVLIIGDGEQRPYLESLVRQLGLEHRVIFIGEVEDVMPYLRLCDIYVSTSLWEGLPYSILESMVAEIPVIATAIPGTTDLVRHGETGFLIPPNDPHALTQMLDAVLSNQRALRTVAHQARCLVEHEYSIDTMITRLEALYRRVGTTGNGWRDSNGLLIEIGQ